MCRGPESLLNEFLERYTKEHYGKLSEEIGQADDWTDPVDYKYLVHECGSCARRSVTADSAKDGKYVLFQKPVGSKVPSLFYSSDSWTEDFSEAKLFGTYEEAEKTEEDWQSDVKSGDVWNTMGIGKVSGNDIVSERGRVLCRIADSCARRSVQSSASKRVSEGVSFSKSLPVDKHVPPQSELTYVGEVSPSDGRKSFYGKAKLFKDKDGNEYLMSYETIVAKKVGGKLYVTLDPSEDAWAFSATTNRHIIAFS